MQSLKGLSQSGRSHAGLCSPSHNPCEGAYGCHASFLPKRKALCLMPDAHQVLCTVIQFVIVFICCFFFLFLKIFRFLRSFPFIFFRSYPAPTELREMGLVLICRCLLIADELWQIFEEGVCKVISAIKSSWVGCDFFIYIFFYPPHSPFTHLH